jgi:hypothetical protein
MQYSDPLEGAVADSQKGSFQDRPKYHVPNLPREKHLQVRCLHLRTYFRCLRQTQSRLHWNDLATTRNLLDMHATYTNRRKSIPSSEPMHIAPWYKRHVET